jgi:hypothetical protein
MSCPGKVFNGVLVGLILALSVCAAMAREQTAVASPQAQAPIRPVEILKTPNPGSSTDNDPTWHFESLSYLWFPGMHGTMGARGYNPSAHMSASDVQSHF